MSTKRWHYIGDVNLEYGGFYARIMDNGQYTDVVRITDLDSGCGFDGAIMIEHLTLFDFDNPEKLKSALACCGLKESDLAKKGTTRRYLQIIDAYLAYGYYDPDDGEIVQCDPDGPREYDGWKVDRVLRGNAKLENYVRKNHLSY